MENQISFFSIEEFLDGEDLAKYDAKLFVIKTILRSCSNRSLIKKSLQDGDRKSAFKWFENSFRTFGFGFVNSYSFSSYCNKGEIKYFYKEEAKTLSTNPKELFDLMIKEFNQINN